MSTSKIVLADGMKIVMPGGAALGYMRAHYDSRAAMLADWEKLTPANLKTVQIKTDGTVTGNYTDLVLESETSTVAEDGSVDTVYKIREKTELELLRERLAVREGDMTEIDTALKGGK